MNSRLPYKFSVEFKQDLNSNKIKVFFNRNSFGDKLSDNSYTEDFYRFHDVFHFSFVTFLDWSPCVRHLLKCKRKSNPLIDEVEDGARARSIEEGISAIIFEEALENDFFATTPPSKELLTFIMKAVKRLEVGKKSSADWLLAITKGYEAFRYLVQNQGGSILFNRKNKSLELN